MHWIQGNSSGQEVRKGYRDTWRKRRKGERGDSGVITPANGVFTFVGDAAGNLYCYYADSATPPTFEVDENGNIYMDIPG